MRRIIKCPLFIDIKFDIYSISTTMAFSPFTRKSLLDNENTLVCLTRHSLTVYCWHLYILEDFLARKNAQPTFKPLLHVVVLIFYKKKNDINAKHFKLFLWKPSSLKPFFISARGVISGCPHAQYITMCWVVSDELFPLDRFSDLFPCINWFSSIKMIFWWSF